MEIFGYVAALIIGLSLGLIGGGGSILTVPVLAYLFGMGAVESTAYSLFIVGLTSAVGAASFFRKGDVVLSTAIWFGVPSILAVYGTRKWLIPHLPHEMFWLGDLLVTRDLFMMGLFAFLMIFAAFSMIRKKKTVNTTGEVHRPNPLVVILEGVIVGTLTGLVGAGGGFLIIPALVLFAGLDMKKAVGTSLLIIAAKSLFGFTGDIQNPELNIDWRFLAFFSVLAIIGILVGSRLQRYVSSEKLKPAFGYFVLVMGVFILLKETGVLGI
ncbi:MAG: sulfite exporter TauE/SafE family protein [Bacteroidota bacterium]|nr:sulfite exporter TauE/SafE family protein [Bacteroidota bacterium]MDX5404292.1 sulfite exporter TauE/SafE family protein [Bacteroidota bacterium]MDX5448297.1 sulfite exporter TauE/SafE family protein [Bacteroidota bacterium]